MKQQHYRAGKALTRIVTGESLDLYILAVTSLIFTVLGASGTYGLADLASMILALLTVLALSQIRSRHQIAALAARVPSQSPLFSAAFPPGLTARSAAASDLLLTGLTLSRTVQGSSLDELRTLLLRGSRIRALLLDPSSSGALDQAASRHQPGLTPERLCTRIQATLDELTSLRDATGGRLDIKVTTHLPSAGITAIDPATPDGLVIVQHYEHRPPHEPGPVTSLTPADGQWFSHFLAEAERMWDDATPWPLSTAETLARAPRPAFRDHFGPELDTAMTHARDLLITGISRNTLLTSRYKQLEELLHNGCQIRVLLLDPAATTAVTSAASRNYAGRSPAILRERITHSLRLLAELQRAPGTSLTIRLISHPLATGTIATDTATGNRSGTPAAFIEQYTYRAPGEPCYVLTPADGHWYDTHLTETEALWAAAEKTPGPNPGGKNDSHARHNLTVP